MWNAAKSGVPAPPRMPPMAFPIVWCLLAACALLTGCTRTLDEDNVREFIDVADDAARKRFAPQICELRGKDFTLRTKFHGAHSRGQPGEMAIDRRLYCVEAGKFSRIRQYRLERKSLDIDLADDRKTARVTAEYVETLPDYDGLVPATPDDFREFQVLDVRDESVVGIEAGDLVFLSTRSEIHQSLVPKSSLKIPYD
jgi:hypothetical protein